MKAHPLSLQRGSNLAYQAEAIASISRELVLDGHRAKEGRLRCVKEPRPAGDRGEDVASTNPTTLKAIRMKGRLSASTGASLEDVAIGVEQRWADAGLLEPASFSTKGWVVIVLKFFFAELKCFFILSFPKRPLRNDMTDGAVVLVFDPGHQLGEVKFSWGKQCPPAISAARPLILQRQSERLDLETHEVRKHVEVLPDEGMPLYCRDAFK